MSKKKSKKQASSVDVMGYFLVPDMQVLSASEREKVLKKFGITAEDMPKIRAKDPVVTALKAQSGDIIRIKRDDTTGKYMSYRVVE